MSTTRHQELLTKSKYDVDSVATHKGIKPTDLVHVMFVKILKEGKRTRDVATFKQFTVKEWDIHVRTFDRSTIAASTGYDEFMVVHDPRKVKPAAKPKGRPAQTSKQ